MTVWRLVALDMDGTVLSLGNDIGPENRRWIQHALEAGVQITFATGRHRRGLVSDLARELHLQAPLVTLNGGEVWTVDHVLLARHPFPHADIRTLLHLAEELQCVYWGATPEGAFTFRDFPADIENHTWLKFGFSGNGSGAVATQVHDRLGPLQRFELTNSNLQNVEVNPQGVSKASGLDVVCRHLGITANEVVGVGDSLNDVAMLKWAGMGVAMGNAQDVVKAAGDWVTDSCDREGVASVIQRVLRENGMI